MTALLAIIQICTRKTFGDNLRHEFHQGDKCPWLYDLLGLEKLFFDMYVAIARTFVDTSAEIKQTIITRA